MNKLSLGGRYIYTFLIGAAVSVAPMLSFAQIEEVVVTANKREQNIQDVSTSITALNEEAIERAGIIDIQGLETVVPGLRIGTSGSEVRPALRGARTNEVGVAGTGIAEQVIGIFQDGVYSPTTTAGLGAYVDIERIEVLRGPQGTLYGRNTFAGSINIISKTPDFDAFGASAKVLRGEYDRDAYEAVVNLPLHESFATRFAFSADEHDGIIQNLYNSSASNDLRNRDRYYLRSTSQLNVNEDLTTTLRFDYSKKDQNADAIWGYQQTAARQVVGTVDEGFSADSIAHEGHVYAGDVITGVNPEDRIPARQDSGPYKVYRDAPSIDKQETFSTTFTADWTGLNFADTKFTLNWSELKGTQVYDANFSESLGFDFGRRDNQEALSLELQFTSTHEGPLSWIGGLYYFDQETEWEWLTYAGFGGFPNTGYDVTRCCLSSGDGVANPHKVESQAIYGQATYEVADRLRVIGGLRYNDDEKEFTPHGQGADVPQPPDWSDDAVLWKAALEYDVTNDTLAYASVATGVRTGGANEPRAAAAGAPLLYDNEEVISYEIGLKNTLLDNTMTVNLSAFANTYEDVKSQLFVRGPVGVDPDGNPVSLAFEYYENGGDVDSYGAELEILWAPTNEALLSFNVAYLDSEFDNGYEIGSARLRPLLGLGNLGGRQDVTIASADLTDENARFSFAGWTPALSPEYTIGLGGSYNIHIDVDSLGSTVLTPSLQFRWVDDYYAFDTNIPEVKQDAHVIGDARLTWSLEDANIQMAVFVKNLFDEEVMTRAVVHNRGLLDIDGGNGPTNSVQVNWNNPRTWGVSFKYSF